MLRKLDTTTTGPRGLRTPGFLRSGRAKLTLGGILLLAGAAPVAASQVWQPETSRPGVDRSVAASAKPVGQDATAVLGVLRRSQTSGDRANAGPRLQAVGMGNQVDGLKFDAVRALPQGWALAPVDSVRVGPDKVTHDQLCITDGTDIGCSPAAGAAAHGTAIKKAVGSQSLFVGIVPDGVARVRFVGTDGSTAEAPVASNFYSLTVDHLAPATKVPPPPDSADTTPIDGPPTPAQGTIKWLDADGNVVGPTG